MSGASPTAVGSPLPTGRTLRSFFYTHIQYLYLGNLLGGLVPGLESKKKADRLAAYDHIQHEDYFVGGIDRLIEQIKNCRTCILCAEENPSSCHRRLLVGASVAERGARFCIYAAMDGCSRKKNYGKRNTRLMGRRDRSLYDSACTHVVDSFLSFYIRLEFGIWIFLFVWLKKVRGGTGLELAFSLFWLFSSNVENS